MHIRHSKGLIFVAKVGCAAMTVLAVSSACTSPLAPDPSGTYAMYAYDEGVLPYAEAPLVDVCRSTAGQPDECPTPQVTECDVLIDEGWADFDTSGTFALTWRRINSCTGELLQASTVTGTYSTSESGRLALKTGGVLPIEGETRGDTIRIVYGDVPLEFLRSDTGPDVGR